MFGEFINQVLLMVAGAIVPPMTIWIWEKLKLGVWRPRPATLRITIISSAVSLFFSLFFVSLYDRSWLPFTKTASPQRVSYKFGDIIQNSRGHSLLVTISAINNAGSGIVSGNSMCAATGDNASKLPSYKEGNCSNPSTVAVVSFNVGGRHTAMTFVVPRGWWYNVLTDGGNVTTSFWTETTL